MLTHAQYTRQAVLGAASASAESVAPSLAGAESGAASSADSSGPSLAASLATSASRFPSLVRSAFASPEPTESAAASSRDASASAAASRSLAAESSGASDRESTLASAEPPSCRTLRGEAGSSSPHPTYRSAKHSRTATATARWRSARALTRGVPTRRARCALNTSCLVSRGRAKIALHHGFSAVARRRANRLVAEPSQMVAQYADHPIGGV